MYQAPRATSPESRCRAAGDGPLTWEGGPWVLARTRCHLREHNEGTWSAKPPNAWEPRQGRSRRTEGVLRPAPGAVSPPEPGTEEPCCEGRVCVRIQPQQHGLSLGAGERPCSHNGMSGTGCVPVLRKHSRLRVMTRARAGQNFSQHLEKEPQDAGHPETGHPEFPLGRQPPRSNLGPEAPGAQGRAPFLRKPAVPRPHAFCFKDTRCSLTW